MNLLKVFEYYKNVMIAVSFSKNGLKQTSESRGHDSNVEGKASLVSFIDA